jgi:hypothetical protein
MVLILWWFHLDIWFLGEGVVHRSYNAVIWIVWNPKKLFPLPVLWRIRYNMYTVTGKPVARGVRGRPFSYTVCITNLVISKIFSLLVPPFQDIANTTVNKENDDARWCWCYYSNICMCCNWQEISETGYINTAEVFADTKG